jgi:hypothetical protein
MKTQPSPLCALACALTFLSIFPVHASTYIYKAQSAAEDGQQILLPDTTNTSKLQLLNNQGVSIGGKPTVGADEKSLVFSGAQVAAFWSVEKIRSAVSGFKCEFSFLLNPKAASSIQTQALIRHSNWEIRCDTDKNTLGVIVWHANPQKKYTVSQVPIKSGVWQRASVSLEGNALTVTVDGSPVSFDIPFPLDGGRVPGPFTIGAAAISAENRAQDSFRPFSGALADINITLN